MQFSPEQRRDDNLGQVEDFVYDTLNRLSSASVSSGPTMSLGYDAVGNLKTKTLSGSVDPSADYALSFLHSADGARLTEIQGDLAATIVDDANGNITARGSLAVSWTPFNKPAQITKNGETSTFKYGPERARYRQDYTEAGETVTRFYVGKLFEAVHRGGSSEYHHHILAAGSVVATHIRRPNGIHATHWALTDHQGSVDVVLDENQQAVGRTTFDAFGGRRSAGWDGLPEPGTIVGGVREFTARGYTGHEQLDGVDIIHMNGRVYDPLIGRFLSPDPIVARPFSSQGWNRFSYVSNNPLSRIDPSGFRELLNVQSCSGNCFGSSASVQNGSVVGSGVASGFASGVGGWPSESGRAGGPGLTCDFGCSDVNPWTGAGTQVRFDSTIPPAQLTPITVTGQRIARRTPNAGASRTLALVGGSATHTGVLGRVRDSGDAGYGGTRSGRRDDGDDADDVLVLPNVTVTGTPQVTLVARPLNKRVLQMFYHSALFVHNGNHILGQFSLSWGQVTFDEDPGTSTSRSDRSAFLNPGGDNRHFPIAPPNGMTLSEFASLVLQIAPRYVATPPVYRPARGPNSNSAAAWSLYQIPGVIVPQIPAAPAIGFYGPAPPRPPEGP